MQPAARKPWGLLLLICLCLLVITVTGCQPAASPTQPAAEEPNKPPTQPVVEEPNEPPTQAAAQTVQPTAQSPGEPQTAEPFVEARQVELEYPTEMQLGESDVIRLTLSPSQDGYVVQAEFPEHQTALEEIAVSRPDGYDLFAVARLDGVAFDLSPQGDQARSLPAGESLTWNWSLTARQPGRQRLALTLLMRWVPSGTAAGSLREAVLFSSGLEVQVRGVLGLPPAQAGRLGLGLIVLVGLAGGAFYWLRRGGVRSRSAAPNPGLALEPAAGIQLSGETPALLRALFAAYARLMVTHEFLSGYSGARTFLAQPIRADGRADAHTIVKVGARRAIEQEFSNYETFVRDTLPPITARIQHAPIRLRGGEQAALRYTFIGEAGRAPVSLRQALLTQPDPGLLRLLFTTFGPFWWQQRRPYTFSLASEYDRLLPAHYVITPASGRGRVLDGGCAPAETCFAVGEVVRLRHFPRSEPRADGRSFTLTGNPRPGQPPLRVRWLGPPSAEGTTGQVTATRATLLEEHTTGMSRLGLPDPLPRLPGLLAETIQGTQSVIHGDLNLENILVGPGQLMWLIDFARTREGHTLLDFAHLEAEITGRVLPANFADPRQFLEQLACGQIPLLGEVQALADQCLFDPARPRERKLAAALACLGALKHANLDPAGRHLLYLNAAYLLSTVE